MPNIPDQNAYFNYYGDANYDVRQRFSFSGVYTLARTEEWIGERLDRGLGSVQHHRCADWHTVLGDRQPSTDVMCNQAGTRLRVPAPLLGAP